MGRAAALRDGEPAGSETRVQLDEGGHGALAGLELAGGLEGTVSGEDACEQVAELAAHVDLLIGRFPGRRRPGASLLSDYEIYSSNRGRTVLSTIHVILSEDLPVSKLDSMRKTMLKEIVETWPWSDTDIVFTIDPSWMKYAVPSAYGTELSV